MNSRLESLHIRPVPTAAPSMTRISPAKLKDVAHQFEASLMQELMEPLAHDSLTADDSGDDSGNNSGGVSSGHDGSMDALGSFARESMAKALSAQGGFGIASAILHSFQKSGKSS